MAIPFAGTSIGADGKRYANNDSAKPLVPPTSSGKYVTQGVLDAAGLEGQFVRTVADGTTNVNGTVTSATAAFTDADRGAKVDGPGQHADAVITAIASATSVTVSPVPTATASGKSITITRQLKAALNYAAANPA